MLDGVYARIHVKWDIWKWLSWTVKKQIRKHFSSVLNVLKHAYLHTILHPFLKNAELPSSFAMQTFHHWLQQSYICELLLK